jgi:CBS domain-containing protein
MIVDPVTIDPIVRCVKRLQVMERFHISGVPVVDEGRSSRRHHHESRSAF